MSWSQPQSHPQRVLSRRHWMARMAMGTSLAASTGACLHRPGLSSSKVARENQQPGTRSWILENHAIDTASRYRCPWVEGYASKTRVIAGERIAFFVSTRPASDYHIDIYRMGYYQGHGGRHMGSWGPFKGRSQTDPKPTEKRLQDCQWDPCLELSIPTDWLSGVYLAKLTEHRRWLQSYVIFIVKDQRQADFMFQCSDHTWQAYNRWPNQFSLYDNGQNPWYWGGGVEVGFNRPYGKYCQIFDAPLSTGSGEFLLWEYPLAYWMESQGYDLTYVSNQDTHAFPNELSRCKGFLSVGHDEYWTLDMFHNLQGAIEGGMHAAFLSGNAVCGRIEMKADTHGNPNRVFERVGVFGPPGGTREFDSMSSLIHQRPYAHELIGAQSTGPVTGGADWICRKPDHWLFAGSGMREGEGIPGLVGWEWHGDPAPIPGLEILASGPTQQAPGQPNGGQYTATMYHGPNGNLVFNAATIWWADGLSEPPGYVRPSVYTQPMGPDSRVQQITHNLLDRMRS